MGRYTPCQNSNSVCFVLDGCSKCLSCTKKGVKYCDGTFSDKEFDSLTAQRNRLVEAAHQKDAELAQLITAVNKAHSERERLQREADLLLEKQKQMLVREAESLDTLDHVDPPEKASTTVFIGMDNKQLEEIFELSPGALLNFEGPISINRPS
ncbi:hypothetical protein PV08_04586 [Exophiala spinifera]|uniref:Uncharacterized protein n=1 Tax=Exophiala spinifera TaxID=91928 RepID=A0A0D1ZXI9_9EURO|nr:uncharacterized protein PV08_04586 [Exophiala spinifera]KIW17392.1 hypothetical protein PV08_04586 [Exophiala spinifera]